MSGENNRKDDAAQLYAMISKAIAMGEVPKKFLEVTKSQLDALDPKRLSRLKDIVATGNFDEFKKAAEAPLVSMSGFNRGVQADPVDPGLDEARKLVTKRIKEKRSDPSSPGGPSQSN